VSTPLVRQRSFAIRAASASAIVMLVLSLLTSFLTFSLPRTNVLLGCVHLLLFGAYLMLMFDR
jgi:Ca2+/H+ antiporter